MEGLNVLSLFDGMSCGQIALERAGKKVDKYFAAEIDKWAIQVAKHNYPGTIHLGSVVDVKADNLPKIDLLIGGSPCQGFSFAGEQLAFEDERSKLFFEYIRLLREIREVNPNVYFLLENVRMKIEHERVITNFLKVRPCRFNSDLVSAQNRERLYWTNIPVNSLPLDRRLVLKDILEKEVDKKYFLSEKALSFFLQNSMKMEEAGNGFRFEPTDGNTKGKAVTTRNGSRMDDNFIKVDTLIDFSHRNEGIRYYEDKSPMLNARDYKQPRCVKTTNSIRKLTPVECERLQTVPDNYTSIVSDTQRYKMLGNGWTVDIIAHILKHMK